MTLSESVFEELKSVSPSKWRGIYTKYNLTAKEIEQAAGIILRNRRSWANFGARR